MGIEKLPSIKIKKNNRYKLTAKSARIENKLIKKATAQALQTIGFSQRKIAKLLDINASTINSWLKLKDEEIVQLKEVMTKQFINQDWKLAQTAISEIDAHLQDKKRMSKTKLWELSGLYKITRELLFPKQSQNAGNNIAIQVNIDKDKFTIDKVDTTSK